MKRGLTNYNFLISVYKPSGITSHDLVNEARNKFGEGRIGHMGTLDPMASGIMFLGVGQAARLNQYLHGLDKTYHVEISFGASTNTYDAEGVILEKADVPKDFLKVDFAINELNKIIGKQKQIPPSFSAIKIKGKVSYDQARKGVVVDLPARDIEVKKAKLLDIYNNKWIVELEVSSGTYIRSLVHDLGIKLNCPAHVSYLKRSKIAHVDYASNLEDINLDCISVLNPIELIDFPVIYADEAMLDKVNNGNKINSLDVQLNNHYCIVTNDKLYAIYYATSTCKLVAESIFKKGINLR